MLILTDSLKNSLEKFVLCWVSSPTLTLKVYSSSLEFISIAVRQTPLQQIEEPILQSLRLRKVETSNYPFVKLVTRPKFCIIPVNI